MSVKLKAFLGAASSAALFAPAAIAQDTCDDCEAPALRSYISVDQVHTGDLWSEMDVVAVGTVDTASASATTTGNSANGLLASGNLDYDTIQQMDGDATAETSIIGDDVTGAAVTVSTAYGNASNAGTMIGNSYAQSQQTMNGDTDARAEIELLGAGSVASASTAIANVAATSGAFGDNMAFQTQTSNGSVTAATDADFSRVETLVAIATTAAGNSVTSTGSTTTSVQGAVQTTSDSETIQAVSDVYAGFANDAVVTTTSSGNSYVLQNEWGFTSLGREGSELYQGNSSEIDAQSYVTLDDWTGTAAVSAYGVGNSAVVGNIGSDTQLHAIQSNFAAVGSQASFSGESMTGGVATLNATAIGNAATATLCITCGEAALSGTVSQFNSGTVYATGTMAVPTGGAVIGTASAIGNSATFQTGSASSGTGGD